MEIKNKSAWYLNNSDKELAQRVCDALGAEPKNPGEFLILLCRYYEDNKDHVCSGTEEISLKLLKAETELQQAREQLANTAKRDGDVEGVLRALEEEFTALKEDYSKKVAELAALKKRTTPGAPANIIPEKETTQTTPTRRGWPFIK